MRTCERCKLPIKTGAACTRLGCVELVDAEQFKADVVFPTAESVRGLHMTSHLQAVLLKPLPPEPDEDLEEAASSMAWTVNDELWETAPEPRRAFWREVARDMIAALMLPVEEKSVAIRKIHGRIEKEGLTP